MKRLLPSLAASRGSVVLSLAFAYIWVLPLFRPRGFYLWGLQIRDLYLGVPVLLVAFCAASIASWPVSSRKAFALRAVTVAFAVGVALFTLDAYYSLVYSRSWQSSPWFDERAFRRQHHLLDSELGYIKKPRSVWRGKLPDGRSYVWHTDENGFGNPLHLRQADLVFIGDSYTEAQEVPVEEGFVHQVSAALGCSAINLGRAGYGPQQQLIALKRYGLGYQPKLVIWQVFEGNDLTDAEFFHRWRHGSGWPVRPFWQRYIDNSLFHAWAEPTLNTQRRFGQLLASVKQPDGSLRSELLRYPYQPDAPQKHRVGWQETQRALAEAYALCRAQKIEMRMVFVPVPIRVQRDDIVFNLAARREDFLPITAVVHDLDFGSRLGRFCRSTAIPYLDLFPPLQASGKTRRDLYIPNDGHFAAAGHEVVTKELHNWIRQDLRLKELRRK